MEKLEELRLKLMLTLARDRQAMQGRVRSVGFIREYLTLPLELGAQTLSQMHEQELEALANLASIKPKTKAAAFHFYLNDTRYHLLHIVNNRIVVLNSVTVEQWTTYEKHALMPALLPAVKAGITNGSIALASLPKEQVVALLNYIWFVGSEDGPAIHQAEGLFMFKEACDMNSWTILDKQQAYVHALKNGYIEFHERAGQAQYSLVINI